MIDDFDNDDAPRPLDPDEEGEGDTYRKRPLSMSYGDRAAIPQAGGPNAVGLRRLVSIRETDPRMPGRTWGLELSPNLNGGAGVCLYTVSVGIGKIVYTWTNLPAGPYVVVGQSVYVDLQPAAAPAAPVEGAAWAGLSSAAPTLVP